MQDDATRASSADVSAGDVSAGVVSAGDVIATPEEMERRRGSAYKWVALSNTTLGVLMVTINASILLIALPDIFRGIDLDPLLPGNTGYLLWLIMGFLVVTAVLVVSFGRVGDMYGRVKMYNLGFAVFTLFSILLTVTWMHGSAGAMWLIVMRVLQGIGGALLFANSSAILTDAFPEHQRGLALDINSAAAIAGSFLGLLIGGLLAPVSWRMVFLVSVPFGLFGTVWAYLKLQDTGARRRERIDWWGNLTFAVGLIAVLAGITYGIQPYRAHTMGWTNPWVLGAILGGLAMLLAFVVIETRVAAPMFELQLFRIRAFSAGNAASLLAALGRGGLQFILIIWLQGIWLPLHGYSFESTPLWAAIYMIPLTVGFLASAPISGYLSDHFGARPFATGGMVIAAASFLFLLMLPVNFNYGAFAAILLLNGIGMGLFSSPNRAGIMNSLPSRQRGVGGGMAATVQNSAQVLSIGIFFSLIILGLASTLSGSLVSGLTAAGVSPADAGRAASLPPVATLFASLLGYNPIQELLGPAAANLTPQQLDYVTGRSFFPDLIAQPFADGLRIAFLFAIVACLVAAVASYLRGGKFHHVEPVVAGTATAATGTGTKTGTAPADETVEPSPEQLTPPEPPAHADAGGSSGTVATAGSPLLEQMAWADGEPLRAEETQVPAPQPGDTHTVTGTVRADGRPVAATVTLTGLGGEQIARTVAGADGVYRLPVPAVGDLVLVVSGRGVEPVAALLTINGFPVTRDLSVRSTAGTVTGRLFADDGAARDTPIRDGLVLLTDAGVLIGRATTDADGRFDLVEVPVGEHVLTASAPGGQPRTALVRMTRAATVEVELRVPVGAAVAGSVRAATDGRPLRQARLALLDPEGRLLATTATDEAGRYRFPNVPRGDYVVTAAGFAAAEHRVRVRSGRTTDADIVLGGDQHVYPDSPAPHASRPGAASRRR